MKKLLSVSLILGILSIVLMIFNFLASTDIYHDYVSNRVVSSGITGDVGALPEWTNCTGEWQVMGMDWIVRFLFMTLIMFVLIKLIRHYKKHLTN